MNERYHLIESRKGRWHAASIGRMLPNMVTLSALCVGLSSVRFALTQEWTQALVSILIAGFLDGIDGRLARFLKVSSEFGAELDSLADFINFGVAPALVVYCFSLQHWGNKGWGACLFFSACMALRLARFNTQRHSASAFSQGMPAPAGALMALSPMIAGFVFQTTLPRWIFAGCLFITALFLISRYPTFVFKYFVIPRKYMGIFFMAALALITGMISALWETLFIISMAYIITLPISGYWFYKKMHHEE